MKASLRSRAAARVRDLSIKRKLVLIALCGVAAAAATIGGVLAASEYLRFRGDTVAGVRSHAQITALNAAAALAFRDRPSARVTLSALRVAPHIRAAAIYDGTGQLFVAYLRNGPTESLAAEATRSDTPHVTLSNATLDHPIEFGDDTVGFVRVEADFGGFLDSLARFAAALLVATGAAIAAAFSLVIPLRNAVAAPIESLAALVARVRAGRDYSLRAPVGGRDELGTLAESFNAMLDVIEDNDRTLRHAKEAAEAASRAKSRFLANMSHEIRTPMNGVLGMAHVMQATSRDPAQSHSLDTIITSGRALLRILNDILDFSKIEAGHLEIVPAPFPVHDHMEDAVQVFAAEARAKGLSLRLSFDPAVPAAASADSLRVRQVLSNLVGNAIKFTHEGSVTVLVDLDPEPATPPRRALRIRVIDTGVGVSAEAQERIFEAFTQSDPTTERVYGGTGLGLSISRQLVALMGGRLGLSSRPGEGSTFWFTVPIAHAEPQPSRMNAASLGLRVLLADAAPEDRQFDLMRMRTWGVTVDVARTREDALARLRAARYDAAIVDDQLPGGWQRLLADLDAVPSAGALRIALLGSGSMPSASGTHQPRVTLEIPKPVQSSALYNFLVDRSQAEGAADGSDRVERIEASVLLVEDNPVNIEVATAMLGSLGCRVAVATSGDDALREIEGARFDLVLMDCQLPGMDGYEATRRIRAREAAGGPRQRIVAVTAHALSGDREACLAAGMDDYLAKPFSLVELAGMLRANTPRPHAFESVSPPEDPEEPEEPVHAPSAIEELRRIEREGRPGLVVRLLDHFETQALEADRTLEAALAGHGTLPAAEALHRLRSTAASLGGRRFARVCQVLEIACRNRDERGLGEAMVRFAPALIALRAALKDCLPSIGALRVLVVDDDDTDRMFIGLALRRAGMSVIEAEDAPAGLRMAERGQPDAVLVDRRLGADDGTAYVAAMARAGRPHRLPVIVVTGSADAATVRASMEAGATGVIEKPLEWSGFASQVRALLDERRVSD